MSLAAPAPNDPAIALAELGEALSDRAPGTQPRQIPDHALPPQPFIDRLQPWVEVFSKIATVAVLALAFLQYYNAGLDKKRERSLQLVDQWIEGGHADRLANVNDYFAASFRSARLEIEVLRDKEMQELARKNADLNTFLFLAEPPSPATEAIRKDIDQLLRFFAQAEICIAAELCDPEVARAYFLVEARSIRTELDPLFKILRAGALPTYGRALDDFIRQVEPEPTP